MGLPQFSMQELVEAGVHFGHKTKRWNPRMSPYIYGARNDVHIINLQHTVPLLHRALQAVREVVAKNGRLLFVGTKRQAQDPIAEAAARCGQHYINQRWLGGMLTNWNTIQVSIKTLRKLEEQLGSGAQGFTKKEVLAMERQKEKLEKSLGGIKDMGGLPDMIFIIDTNKEDLAVKEASKLGIPIVAILDSNSSPDGITHPIPGNDDATRAVRLYCRLISDAALDGIQEAVKHSDVDMGASEEVPFKDMGAEAKEEKPAEHQHQQHRGKKGAAKAPVVVKKPSMAEKMKHGAEEAEHAEAETHTAVEAGTITAEENQQAPAKKPAAKKESAAKKPAKEKTAAKKESKPKKAE